MNNAISPQAGRPRMLAGLCRNSVSRPQQHAKPQRAGWPPGDFKCRLSTVVVHLICNQGVVGSNPTAGTIDFNDIR